MTRLHMLRLPLDLRQLYALGHAQGHVAPRSDPRHAVDPGYLAHAALKALFAEAAPKPFAFVAEPPHLPAHEQDDGASLPTRCFAPHLLAYAPDDLDVLHAKARETADPLAYRTVDWDAAAAKPMPEAFAPGRRLGFRVEACPVVRIGRGSARFHPGSEQDAFVAWLAGQGVIEDKEAEERAPAERARVYLDWFARQVEGAARIETVRIEAVRGARLWRNAAPKRTNTRPARAGGSVLERRAATFAGTLAVEDGTAFAALLARGVGRHRAFGFGMLLLRPAA